MFIFLSSTDNYNLSVLYCRYIYTCYESYLSLFFLSFLYTVVNMSQEENEKVIVHLIYPCIICANEYTSAHLVIQHIKTVHGYICQPRSPSHHRPEDEYYKYEVDIRKKWDVQHYACPTCWFHIPKEVEVLMEHVMTEHQPEKIESFVHPHEKEVDELEEEGDDNDTPRESIIPEEDREQPNENKLSKVSFEDKSHLYKAEQELLGEIFSRFADLAASFKKLLGDQ